ncbi:MAG TPA: M28 family peptidase [Verrucomicrobiae bacterium]|nr:M28 family peptidase [Verrucomicrobiae bacterium]
MIHSNVLSRTLLLFAMACFLSALGCKSGGPSQPEQPQPPFMSSVAGNAPAISPADAAPPPDKTDGFDGKRAYDQVAKQVSFGPRPPGSPAIAQLQGYLVSELKSYGCQVDTDSFSADTPVGRVPMKNILAKIPGKEQGIILLGTHYDTKKMANFVGADDAGSSTGVMLEIARLLCAQPPQKYAVWIAFFDAEEAFNPEWHDPDNTYGSRQMAAQLAQSGDLPKIKAFILADLVGGKTPHFRREAGSTKWLADLVWSNGQKLGYGNVFVVESTAQISDDHFSFTKRNVPSVDIIDLDAANDVPYWHTPQDTLDKISPKTLAIVGHTILASIQELQKK